MAKQLIRLGHSPDPDDAFMFYALAKGLIDPGPFEFEHILQDIQTLNDRAQNAELEVTAVSVHAYAWLQDKYALLATGASMGATELATYIPPDNNQDTQIPTEAQNTPAPSAHGPLLIAREPLGLDQASKLTIAIPGILTSAFLALRLALGEFKYQVIPFDKIPLAVKEAQTDAGLIIHESQLTYSDFGLHCLLDLGKWWFDKTALPLPLGCNIIRRDLGPEKMAHISRILKQSIAYSLNHRREAIEYALQFGQGINLELADQFIGMYVNKWTLDYGPAGQKALSEFLKQGHQAGIIPPITPLQFI